jgi:hypothetical protein
MTPLAETAWGVDEKRPMIAPPPARLPSARKPNNP